MTKPINDISADVVRWALHYDAETGAFRWRSESRKRSDLKEIAGSTTSNGYIQIKVGNRKYFAHRLAWLYVYGEWPKNQVDHIDGCRTNNRIANLRDATNEVNCQNLRRAHSKSSNGYLGVTRVKDRWASNISVNGKRIRIGVFDTPEQAHQAYITAKRQLHPGCTI